MKKISDVLDDLSETTERLELFSFLLSGFGDGSSEEAMLRSLGSCLESEVKHLREIRIYFEKKWNEGEL